MLFPGNKNQQHATARILLALRAARQAIPTLADLESRFDISRRTLQRARAKLARLGLIEHLTWMNNRYGGQQGWKLSGRMSSALRLLAEKIEAWRSDMRPTRREKKETERAIALLLDGIKEYPEEYSFHVALADIHAEEKRFDAADAEYEAARRAEKGAAYYRSLYGQARMRIQNEFEPGRAVELLDEFIAGEPDGDNVQSVAHACWRKGNALEQLGRTQDAREAYEESLRREPGLKLSEKALDDLKE